MNRVPPVSPALPVAVIGAGPVGLAAAHLLARGETPVIFEVGAAIGAAIRDWAHVRLFSPWWYCIDEAAAALLDARDWQRPDPDHHPTGAELLREYLEPLARTPQIAAALRLNVRVVAVARRDADKVRSRGRECQPFVVRWRDAAGRVAEGEFRAVIDASGTWTSPNPAGVSGLPAPGEVESAARLRYGIPDVLGAERARYAGKRVLVVGSGHSALNAMLDLVALAGRVPATRVLWALRSDNLQRVFGGGTADALPARGLLGLTAKQAVEAGRVELLAPFRIRAMAPEDDGALRVFGEDASGATRAIGVDEVIVATGFRPDLEFLRELRLSLDPDLESAAELGPLIDPNVHSCGSVPPHGHRELAHREKDFYIVGMKSYGRAPTFLLLTGYEQARSVAAALAGDLAAADNVHLVLPETGVCSLSPAQIRDLGLAVRSGDTATVSAAAACCGGPAPEAAFACCADATAAKAAGESGCGCDDAPAAPAKPARACCG
ncbi:MAG: NAD(P)-binding domain-containing protein [Pseudomonadota bacterium]